MRAKNSWTFHNYVNFKKKKMIVNCLIKELRLELKIEFNIDFEQFMAGIDKAA